MSSLQSLQESCRLSRPSKCGCTNCAELVEEQVAQERWKLSKSSDVLPSGSGDDNFTKLLGPARGTSLSGLQIWIDLGDISEDKDSEIAAVASTSSDSGLVGDKALRRCGEESDRLQVVSTMVAQSGTNYRSYDVMTSRTFPVGVGSGSSSVVVGSHTLANNHRSTSDRVEVDLSGAKVKKETSLKRVRFSDHNTVYFIPLPECDTDEDDLPCDIPGCSDSDDYEAHGSNTRLGLGLESSSADEESGSREANSLACGNHCVDSVITDRVPSLLKNTDEFCENDESRSMEVNGLENPGKPGGNSNELDPAEDSVATLQLLKEIVAFSDGKSEKGVSHANEVSRLLTPVRVKVESPVEQEYAITCRNEPELEAMRRRNKPEPVQADASSSRSRSGSDREFEDAKRDLELLVYDVDRMYALDPSISPSYGRAQRWSMVDVSEDNRKLTFKRKANRVKKKGLKRAKRSEPSLSGGVDCSTIGSDDLEAEDDLLGRPVWMRQYKSVNALVS